MQVPVINTTLSPLVRERSKVRIFLWAPFLPLNTAKNKPSSETPKNAKYREHPTNTHQNMGKTWGICSPLVLHQYSRSIALI
jgi:hypothetical protein